MSDEIINQLLDAYYGLSKACTKDLIEGKQTDAVKAMKTLETALVSLGVLEDDEEEEPGEEIDYTNDTAHWDEWAADQRYDMYRDLALMGYEY